MPKKGEIKEKKQIGPMGSNSFAMTIKSHDVETDIFRSISKKVCLQGPEETTDIVTKVTPLHQMSYEEQLSLKMKQTTDSLCNISRQMREANSDFPSGTRFSYFGELLPIVPCPVQR